MMKFKYFFNCCCKYLDEKEEEKIQSGTKIESFNKSLGESHNFIINLGDESSIIAAPFPNHDGNSIDYPRLRIRIIESSAVPVGTILTINPTGMEGSKRNKADYKTFIGSKLSENDEILNDFVIEESSKGMGKQHLVIKFNPPKQKYSITDLGDGSGTFVRIDSPLVLKDGFIISFGNSHMTIHYDSSQKDLTIKFLEGPKNSEVYTFTTKDDTILVGRMVDCRVRFDDNSMSRYQCSIFHDERGWVLVDGMGDKKSTNGTWLFVEEDYEIFDKLVFKAGKTLFQVQIE